MTCSAGSMTGVNGLLGGEVGGAVTTTEGTPGGTAATSADADEGVSGAAVTGGATGTGSCGAIAAVTGVDATAPGRIWARAESSACAASIPSPPLGPVVALSSRPKYGPGTGSQARGEKIAAASSKPATNDDAKIPPALFSDMPDRPPGLRPVSARVRSTISATTCRRERTGPSKRIDSYDPKNRFRRCGSQKLRSRPGERGVRQGKGSLGKLAINSAGPATAVPTRPSRRRRGS